ncbi:MAG: TetR/AcrR family transcriptional regulator [Thermodesulfobacteriota bacterium]
MTEIKTKDRLLDTAERLFAERGVKETSVRDITKAARTHLASVNYHFRSKNGLIRGVIARRIKPLNKRRFELLDSYIAEAGDEPVTVERILHALIAPSIELYLENPNFLSFAGRMISTPDKQLHRTFASQMDEVFFRLKDQLMLAIPDIPETELMWRIHFTTGAIIHTWTNHADLEIRSGGICKIKDKEEVINELIAFCGAGLRA